MSNDGGHRGAVAPGPLATAFREVMSGVCTPVSVVTAMADGVPHGTTVSAFTSLSMDPPMILVSLDSRSELLTLIRRTGRFGLNVLASGQAALALQFARKGGPGKFAGVAWHTRAGVPQLPGASGFLVCDVADAVGGGDHLVLLGTVHTAEGPAGAPPLTYHARRFGTHTAFDGVPA
jgi:flavin reductase (DIM6/NTAB) family NADH-FMN oxidoreductase RutF